MLLLMIIYLGFISLGLPDSLFGSAWPVLQLQFDVPVSYAGFVTTVISGGTIISSLLSDKINRRLGTGLVTAISVAMTAVSLIGFSLATNFYMLIAFAVPLGLGAGGVDAALNNYMAIHYSSRHMSWLHCFWGVGASVSPYIMSFWLSKDSQWDKGYLTVGVIQTLFAVALFLSLPLWKKGKNEGELTRSHHLTFSQIFRLKGIKSMLFGFLAYCAIESTAFAWTSSYLVSGRGMNAEIAAGYASLFYLGMTTGRLITGFFADKTGDKNMIRLGWSIGIVGLAMVLLPLNTDAVALCGLFVLGFGCGPIYPAIIHSTPTVFGVENSQSIVGIQMAFAYTGSTLMPPLFGIIARRADIRLFPVFLSVFMLMTVILTEKLRVTNKTSETTV